MIDGECNDTSKFPELTDVPKGIRGRTSIFSKMSSFSMAMIGRRSLKSFCSMEINPSSTV